MSVTTRSATANAIVVLPRLLMIECHREIDSAFPNESGGVLIGRHIDSSRIVIDGVVGPGPDARHERYRFEPNLEWQHARIAEHFERSDGLSNYLGDWHSHPRARHGRLSHIDRRALRKIIDEPAALCPKPLMAIYWGSPDAWTLSAWEATLRSRLILGSCIGVAELTLDIVA